MLRSSLPDLSLPDPSLFRRPRAGLLALPLGLWALALAACGEPPTLDLPAAGPGPADDPTDDPDGPEEPAGPCEGDGCAPAPIVGQCASSLAWFEPGSSSFMVLEGTFLGITPNEGLVVSGDALSGAGAVARASDGEVLAEGTMSNLLDTDDEWQRRLERGDDWRSLVLKQMITGEEQLVLEGPEETESVFGALSDDGTRVAAGFCQAGALLVKVVEVGPPAADPVFENPLFEATIALETEHCPWWGYPIPRLRFLSSEGGEDDSLLVTVPSEGRLRLFSLLGGEVFEQVLPTPDLEALPEEVQWMAEETVLLDVAVSPDHQMVVTTGVDGALRRFKLPGLVPVDEATHGVVPVNLSVYAPPRLVAPLTFSPDGAVIAALDDEGQIELRDAKSGAVLRTLPAPEPQAELSEWELEEYGRPLAAAFSPSGSAVAVSFKGGVGLWRCEGTGPEAGAPLAVLLEGPSTAAVGEAVAFTATHLGSAALHAHSFYVDGALLWGAGGLGRTATWTAHEPGTYEISVVVDDGASTGAADLTLTVE